MTVIKPFFSTVFFIEAERRRGLACPLELCSTLLRRFGTLWE
jgi:hypothetical protein